MINRVLERAKENDKVSVASGVYELNRANLKEDDLSAVRAEVDRGRYELLDGIRKFAKEHFGLDWSQREVASALQDYTDAFSSRVLAAAMTGGDIQGGPPDTDPDRYVIHRFASHVNQRDQRLFEDLLVRVKGRMLADCLYYLGDDREDVPSLERVEVYLDGPVLLFALGYAGPEIQGQYTELLDMLHKQAAVIRCFEHSVTEAREILDAAAGKVRTGQGSKSFHGDVVSHLVRSGKSPVEIELLSDRLPNDLLKLAINPVETPARKEHLQSNEESLGDRLQRRLGYTHKVARDRDIDSLTAIYRLRDGKDSRDLAECRALFVTHNFSLFQIATSFFRSKDRRAVSPCAHDAALTTMLWLREPANKPDLPRDRIIADAYAALNPKPALWQKYNDEIEHLRNEGHLGEEDTVFLRYGREAQESLMDETRGNPDTFTAGTVAQVLERSREVAEAGAKERLVAAESKANSATDRLLRSQERVHAAAHGLGNFIATGGLVVFTALLLLGIIYGPVGPIQEPFVPGVLQLVAAILAIFATVVTMFFRPTFLEYRATAALWITVCLENFGLRILRLEDLPDEKEELRGPE